MSVEIRSRCHAPPMRRAPVRAGMTLIEVLIAVVILGGCVISMGGYMTRFQRAVNEANARAVGSQLAADRLELVKGHTNYVTLESTWEATEATIAGFPGYSRRTDIVRHTGTPGAPVDYMMVTVTVSGARLETPIKHSTAIARF